MLYCELWKILDQLILRTPAFAIRLVRSSLLPYRPRSWLFHLKFLENLTMLIAELLKIFKKRLGKLAKQLINLQTRSVKLLQQTIYSVSQMQLVMNLARRMIFTRTKKARSQLRANLPFFQPCLRTMQLWKPLRPLPGGTVEVDGMMNSIST